MSRVPELYWSGGPSRVRLVYPPSSSPDRVSEGVSVLDAFRYECQRMYFAFNSLMYGIGAEVKRRMEQAPDAFVSVGSTFPNMEQSLGRSSFAFMRQGDFLDAVAEGGEFENLRHQAMLVMIYHRWDEVYRSRISQIFAVPKNDVDCVLMGEVRSLRNVIVHQKAVVPENFSCPFLELIWGALPSGQLRMTDGMVHSFMEQVNALRVEVNATR